MTYLTRALRILLPALLLSPVPALAQAGCTIPVAGEADLPEYAHPDDPWIYRGTDIPVDGQWLFGELPNGVRYAVRQNGVPPCQVSMRIRIDAGSLHEDEDERGFAHLIEHLTFRESSAFGMGEAIPHFQRLGASFGNDTNAITSSTQTVYQLDLPNARRNTLEDSVRLFAGMIQQPTLSADALAADLPIVMAERRERAGPEQRVQLATREVLFAGQRLADRTPIGTVESLQVATPEAVRASHRRWYRPENTVVVMVGDAAPDVLAAMVERHFGQWQVPGAVTPEPDFGDPEAPAGAVGDLPIGETAVLVEPGQPLSLTYAILRPWIEVVDNLEYNRGLLIDSVATAIINRRLEENARAGASYLIAAVEQDKISRSVDGTFVSLTPLTDDWESALADVRSVIANALAEPPSEAEIEREAAQFDIAFVDMVSQERIQAGSQLADNLVNAVDIREAVAAPETFLSVFRNMRDRLTPETILEHTRALFEGNVVRGVLLTPEIGEASEADVRVALERPAVANGIARSEAEAVSFAELPPIGTPSTPVVREPLGPGIVSNVERLTFANGVRALIRDSDNEPGRVTVRVRFGAGWRGFGDDEAVYAEPGRMALVNSGLGPLGQSQLDRIATGRKLTFNFSIGDGAFEFEGITRAEDLADQLYLFAAKLADPRWDAAPFERARASALLSYETYSGSPTGIINRDLDYLLRDSDPRFATPTPEQLREASPEEFRRVWTRLLEQGPVEVSVFGDIDPEATIEMLGRTFGALPEREELPLEIASRGLDFPAASNEPMVIRHGGESDQGAALIAWPTGGGSAGLPQSRKLELLAQVFANRLIDGMRERYGSSYSPFASSNWPTDVESGGHLLALVQLEPENVPGFFDEAERIAQDRAMEGPMPDELARAVEPVRQYISRAQTGHTFWLNQLEGAAFDADRVAQFPTLWLDYLGTTPEEIRQLAGRYLAGHNGFRLAILPEETPSTR